MQEKPHPFSEMEDHQLLKKARQNDMQAIAMIHDRYYPKVWSYVSYRIPDQQICEDITADVFMRFITNLQGAKKEIQQLGGWLMGTASHLVMDHYRDAYKKPLYDLDEQSDLRGAAVTQEDVEQSIRLEDLQSVLTKLTFEQQHVLTLRFAQEFSLEETAHVMHKSVGAIKLLQLRAVQSLRKLLEKRGWA